MCTTDRIDLMDSLNITIDNTIISDDLQLSRYGITIPYNVNNFMLFTESALITDILRKFRQKQIGKDGSNFNDTLDNVVYMSDIIDINRSLKNKKDVKDNSKNKISLKKQNIKKILIKKGLMCS